LVGLVLVEHVARHLPNPKLNREQIVQEGLKEPLAILLQGLMENLNRLELALVLRLEWFVALALPVQVVQFVVLQQVETVPLLEVMGQWLVEEPARILLQ